MSSRKAKLLAILIAVCFIAASDLYATNEENRIMLQVGFGKRDITPPLGTPCALGLDNEAVEIFDNIFVRVLVIKSGQDDVFGILSAEVLGIYRREVRELRELIAPVIGTSEDRIVIHAQHQHESPNMRIEYGEELAKYGLMSYSPEYYQFFKDQSLAAFREAVLNLFEAQVSCGEGFVSEVASNRRMMNPNGTVYMRGSRPEAKEKEYPEGHIDPLVRVVSFKSNSGGKEILLFSYACHPSAAGGDEGPYVSGDFPGYACRAVESALEDVNAIFFEGACGDINPGKYIMSDRAGDAKRMGENVARGVLEAYEKLGMMEADPVSYKSALVNLPLNEKLSDAAAVQARFEAGVKKFKKSKAQGKRMPGGGELRRDLCNLVLLRHSENGYVTTEVDALKIGDLCMVFLPGECFLEIAERIRVNFPKSKVIVVPYCDYNITYVPPPFAYKQGGYEPSVAVVTPEAFGILVDTSVGLLKELNAK